MKCFYSDSAAIGLCKSCGRGLSLAFATEFPTGLACKNRCEADVQALISLHASNLKQQAAAAALLRSSRAAAIASGAFSMLAGGGFLYFDRYSEGLSLIGFMGGAFIAYGLYTFVRALVQRKK